MLSAKKENTRSQEVISATTLPVTGSVCGVVTSIQGLQQRLDDFTLEEITKAEETAKFLLLRLSDLDSRLGFLSAIQRSVAAAHKAIEQAQNEGPGLNNLEGSDRAFHLHEIVQASKLIRFPRLDKLSLTPTRVIAAETSVSDPNSPAVHIVESRQEAIQRSTDLSREQPPDCDVTPEFVDERAEATQETLISSEEFSWQEEPINPSDESPNEQANDNLQTASKSEALPVKAAIGADTETLSTQWDDPSHGEATAPEEPVSSPATETVKKAGDFDQRLLDDLIKNYGEIFSTTSASKTIEPQPSIETITAASTPAPVIEEAPLREVTKESTSLHLPTLKKEGEIDRQLKKIIKDYGEYDIYSRQSPINVKLGVIGAFLLLGAVFSGFYFFSSPKSLESPNSSAVNQPAQTTSSTESAAANKNSNSERAAGPGNHESKEKLVGSEGKTINKSPISKK